LVEKGAWLMASTFEENTIGLRAFLMTDPDLAAGLLEIGNDVLKAAQDIAPIGSAPHDKDPGEYRDSLYIEKHVSPSRMSVRVGSKSFKAWWIEYGTKHTPKFAVLRRALDSVNGGARSASSYAGVSEYDALNTGNALKRAVSRTKRARKTQLRTQSRGG
jgi:hypothetical protein